MRNNCGFISTHRAILHNSLIRWIPNLQQASDPRKLSRGPQLGLLLAAKLPYHAGMGKLFWVLLLASAASAQPAVAGKAPLAFEVASVKPALSDRPRTMGRSSLVMTVDNAQVQIGNATVAELIHIAFRVRPYQVTGPAWLNATGASAPRFTVLAKMPEGATKEQMPEMLQTLLAERFQLAFHREEKEHAVFALVVGKGGSKLVEIPPDQKDEVPPKVAPIPGGNTIHMEQDLTIGGLCDLATRFMDRPVVDMTDLKGRYHMVVELSIDDMRTISSRNGNPAGDGGSKPADAAADPTGGTIIQSVQAMGLKLESRKMMVSQVVIDRLEKSPLEN